MIREAHIDELGDLEPLARSFYAASEAMGPVFDIARFRSVWTALLARRAGVIFISRVTGKITGTIGGIVRADLYSPRLIADELFWYSLPGARGDGVRLYRAFEHWALEQGAEEIQMCHLWDSMPAKVARFYSRLGYRPAEVRFIRRFSAAEREESAA